MEKLFGKSAPKTQHQSGEEWITYSDLMSGLMMVFLFIAISYMSQVAKDKIQLTAITYSFAACEIPLRSCADKRVWPC